MLQPILYEKYFSKYMIKDKAQPHGQRFSEHTWPLERIEDEAIFSFGIGADVNTRRVNPPLAPITSRVIRMASRPCSEYMTKQRSAHGNSSMPTRQLEVPSSRALPRDANADCVKSEPIFFSIHLSSNCRPTAQDKYFDEWSWTAQAALECGLPSYQRGLCRFPSGWL